MMAIPDAWLDCAQELFMRLGVRNVTMDDLVRAIGISKKTMYQSISSKDELVEAVVYRFIEGERARTLAIAASSANAIEEILLVTEQVVQSMQQMKTNIVHELQRYYRKAWRHVEAYQREHVLGQTRRNLERGIAEGLYRTDMDVELIARLHTATSFSLFDERWFPSHEFLPGKVFREFLLHDLRAMVSDKGRALLQQKLSDTI